MKTENTIQKSTIKSDVDKTVIEELLRNNVSLSRVCELFLGRTTEKDVTKIARQIVIASDTNSSADGNKISGASSTSQSSSTVPNVAEGSLPRLGTEIINRSASATHDATFMKAHAANLAKEAPEELLDPLFFTVMNDPVVLSSGYVVDRDNVLDDDGGLKFSFCPFTRAPLKEDVYPLVCRRRMVKEYRERTLVNVVDTANRLLEERSFEEFEEVMSTAERFIDNLGESTYARLSSRLAKLTLKYFEIQDISLPPPEELAKLYIRVYRGSSSFHNCSPSKSKVENKISDESTEDESGDLCWFQLRIKEMFENVDKAIKCNELDKANEWLDACEMVLQACPTFNLPTAKLHLELAKARGEEDLFPLHRHVYEEIRSDPHEVARFCNAEGIHLEDLVNELKSVTLLVKTIFDHGAGEEWRCALKSETLEYEVASVRVHAGDFTDQDWGNTKGNLGLALYDTNEVLVSRCNLFGTYRTNDYNYGIHPARVLDRRDDIVSLARPGFKYSLEYTVGGGGGHELNVTQLYCKIFPVGFLPNTKFLRSYTMYDPESDSGLFTGQVDRNGKAHGVGELVYYDYGMFIGEFFGGIMKTGVLYDGKEVSTTMTEGSWDSCPKREVIERFPLRGVLYANAVPENTDSDSDDSEESSDSVDEEEIIDCSFHNASSFQINIVWVDQNTGEENPLDFDNPYEPDESCEITSYNGHVFIAYSESLASMGRFEVRAGASNNFVIEEIR